MSKNVLSNAKLVATQKTINLLLASEKSQASLAVDIVNAYTKLAITQKEIIVSLGSGEQWNKKCSAYCDKNKIPLFNDKRRRSEIAKFSDKKFAEKALEISKAEEKAGKASSFSSLAQKTKKALDPASEKKKSEKKKTNNKTETKLVDLNLDQMVDLIERWCSLKLVSPSDLMAKLVSKPELQIVGKVKLKDKKQNAK
jgi:hypothetical protein